MKAIGTLLALLLIVSSVKAQEVLTPEQAVVIGLEKNFSISMARNTAEIAENNSGRGTANFLPLLNASGALGYSESETTTNSPFSFGNTKATSKSASISLDWTLFDGFRMFADNARYNELARLGKEQARSIIEVEVVRILSAYYNVVQQEQLLRVAESTLAVSEDRLKREEARRDLGGASTTDYLNARVAYNTDRSAFTARQLQVSIAQKDLNQLLGREPDSPLQVQESIDVPGLEFGYEQLITLALEQNSSLKAAAANLRASKHAVTINRSAFLPRIALNGTYGYSDRVTESSRQDLQGADITNEALDKSVNLVLTYNLFNGFRDNISVQNAKIEVMNQELALSEARLQLRADVKEMYESYENQMELVRLAAENVQTAEQNQELMRERYNTGTATSLEFRDAQVSASRARSSLLTAQFQARITLLQIQRMIGRIEVGEIVQQ